MSVFKTDIKILIWLDVILNKFCSIKISMGMSVLYYTMQNRYPQADVKRARNRTV